MTQVNIGVNIGEVSSAATTPLAGAPRIESAVHVEPVPVEPVSVGAGPGPIEQALHAARLSAVVELIENVTGRQVKLVPPFAYFVSRPAPPVQAPVDVVVRADMEAVRAAGTGPLVVGIHSIVESGTARRMVLHANAAGGLDLSTAVDLDL